MLEKLKNALEKAREKAEAAQANLGVSLVPDSVSAERFAMCSSCEYLYKPTNTCKKCGCFMKIKTTLALAKCPVGKWGHYEIPNKTE